MKCRPRGLVVCDKRGINVGATFMSPGWRTHACGRLRCLPAVGRASQVAPLRVGGGLGVAVIIRHVRRGDIHVARMAAVKCRPRGLVACDKRGIHVGATFMSPGWRTHACGCVASLRSAGRHKWRPYVWAVCAACGRRFVRGLAACGRRFVRGLAACVRRFGWRWRFGRHKWRPYVWAVCAACVRRFGRRVGWCALYAVRAGCV